jgi:hypothetical protein
MKILCVPDIHQNIKWAQAIINDHIDEVDHLVLLGDFFDGKDEHASTKETCKFLIDIERNHGHKTSFLKGNHDMQYYYAYNRAAAHRNQQVERNPYMTGAYSKNRASKIAKHLTKDFIRNTQLAVYVDKVLYTHAGVVAEMFKEHGDVHKFIAFTDKLNMECLDGNCPHHPLLGCGQARNGPQEYGGLLWCDFDDEFHATNDMPIQIFGHTRHPRSPAIVGHNYCIDGAQSYYAIVTDGVPVFFGHREKK